MLVACSHGTASPEGRQAIADLRARLTALRPDLEVAEAYVDVERPEVGDVVQELAARGRACIVVPLLLSTGYHVRVDVAGAVSGRHGLAVAARPLGPDPALVDILLDRLAEAGTGPADTVLLAAAGSSDPQATGDVEQVAAALTDRLGRPVPPCYLSAGAPTVSDAVAAALSSSPTGGSAPPRARTRANGSARTRADSGAPARGEGGAAPGDGPGNSGDIVVAAYLLSPGFFADRLVELAIQAGASRVTTPLAGHPALAELLLRRYDDARTGRPPLP